MVTNKVFMNTKAFRKLTSEFVCDYAIVRTRTLLENATRAIFNLCSNN